MAEKFIAPKGTRDIFTPNIDKWQYVEGVALETAKVYGFSEIRLPIFEHTEVFERSVGDTTDVVSKEMYTFNDKGGRSITLRPEMTAGVVRSVTESGAINGALPLKLCYIGPCFRYEKPQAGRLRQFNQFGVEMFGAKTPYADVQVIMLADSLLNTLGINEVSLNINSIGCPVCRKNYNDKLVEYLNQHKETLCDTCKDRMDKNPMRVIDCKSPICQDVVKDAPRMLDYLCDECDSHFEQLKELLIAQGIEYSINPSIVRGLDYYTKTVFEFVSTAAGSQGTVCGGGRYDGMVAQMGGPDTAGIGFGMGIERLLMVMEAEGADMPEKETCDIFFASMGKGSDLAFSLATKARDEGFIADSDIVGRSLKAQMKYADKIGAKYSAVIGDDEVDSGEFTIKNMETGEQIKTSVDTFIDEIYKQLCGGVMDNIYDLLEGNR